MEEENDIQTIENLALCVRNFNQTGQHEHDTQNAISRIFDLCHNTRPTFTRNQDHAARLGVIDELITVCTSKILLFTRQLAFRALGQMCFANEHVSSIVGCNDRLILEVSQTLSHPSHPHEFKNEAIYPLKNAAGNSWETHHKLIQLLPLVLQTYKNTIQIGLRVQCIFFLGVLAYNPGSRPALLEAGALEVLVEVMRCNDVRMFPTSAAIAVACLVGEQPGHAALQVNGERTVLQQLTQALTATLQGSDFPQNSGTYYTGWKLMMGISNLCRSPANSTSLRQAGLGLVVRQALLLSKANEDARMIHHCLVCLWLLYGNPE